jgi:hypothetical protein
LADFGTADVANECPIIDQSTFVRADFPLLARPATWGDVRLKSVSKVDRDALRANPKPEQAVRGFSAGPAV